MRSAMSVLVAAVALPAAAQVQTPRTPAEIAKIETPSTPPEIAIVEEDGAFHLRKHGTTLPLYTFDLDAPDKSNCNFQCAETWPPISAPPGSKPIGEWTSIARGDGSAQWSYRGKPIYTYTKDRGRPDHRSALGDGAGGVWHVVTPIARAPAPATNTPNVPAVVKIAKGPDGPTYFTDLHGYSLYSFDRDTNGKSLCSGNCATAWPPLTAADESTPVGDWTILRRSDGKLQWAYKGRPVYRRKLDKPNGGHSGDGAGGVWHLVKW